jgi:hypothetical protein
MRLRLSFAGDYASTLRRFEKKKDVLRIRGNLAATPIPWILVWQQLGSFFLCLVEERDLLNPMVFLLADVAYLGQSC